MSILSVMTPTDLSVAICTEDRKAIARAPGIGPKTAARIILELKDKLGKDVSLSDTAETVSAISVSSSDANLKDAYEALTMLGYDKSTITAALKGINTKNIDAGEIIRLVLAKFSK